MASILQVASELVKIKVRINKLIVEAICMDDMVMVDNLNEAIIHIDNALEELKKGCNDTN